ncbi:MAG: hypothetical protein RIM84_21030 [Alphaproteobacteria bacterium]
MSSITRRTVLAAGAALPAVGVLPAVGGADAAADPVVALWRRYEAAMAQWNVIGPDAVFGTPREAAANALMIRANAIGREMERTPATTMEGVICKARLGQELYGACDDDLHSTLLDDLERLSLGALA